MLKNHLVIAWRNLAKFPGYSLLNVGGLALGIAAAFVLGLFAQQELTYDRHFEDGDRIYRVATDFYGMGGFAKSQAQLVDALVQEVPAVEVATRFDRAFQPVPVHVGERRYDEPHIFFADSAFFDVFSHRFLSGTKETALRSPGEAVLSDELARTYFGDAPALGRMLLIGKEKTPYRVAGVVERPLGKTHLAADLWLPLELEDPDPHWTNVTYYNYVKLRPGTTQADLERGLEALRRDHAHPASASAEPFDVWAASPQAVIFDVQPLWEIYLHSDYNFEIAPGGSPTTVYILGLIGAFVLLIAGVNYVNLTTARSTVRAREVGVKKTLGASRRELVQQFLAETTVLSVLAMGLALGLAEGMLAAFAFTTGSELVGSVFADGRHVLALLGFSVLLGLAAGLYPALYLSGFRPAETIKGGWTLPGNQRLRAGLVVVQFAVAIALVIGSLVVHEQLGFMRETDKGLDDEGVLIVENLGVLGDRADVFRRGLDALPEVERTSLSRRVPTGSGIAMFTYQTPEMEESVTLQTFRGDADYLPTLGLRLVAGRNFSADRASDSSAVILNETAVRTLGLGEDPIGKAVNDEQYVLGVVRDFHFASLRERIEPVVLSYSATGTQLAVRLHSHDVSAVLDRMQALWQRLGADEPVRYAFLDDNFAQMAEQERVLGRAVLFFTLLALLIAAMGLFGLTAFAVQRRTKEIGIRKVLGASVASVVALLTRDFLTLVAVAAVVAAPVAYVLMSRWLDGFAYRVALGPGVFLLAGGLALAVALLTVSAQALRAATADPVRSLRYE